MNGSIAIYWGDSGTDTRYLNFIFYLFDTYGTNCSRVCFLINEQDVKRIKSLNSDSLGYDFPLENTASKLKAVLFDKTHHLLFGYEVEETKKLIGYVHAEVYDTLYFPSPLNVLALVVDQNERRSGVGSQLMLALEEEAKKRMIGMIRLNSGSIRTEAHFFYESLGYNGEKLQKRFIKVL